MPSQYLLPSGEELDHIDLVSHLTEDTIHLEDHSTPISLSEIERIVNLAGLYSTILPLDESVDNISLPEELSHQFSLHLLSLRKKYFKGAFRHAAAVAAKTAKPPLSHP